MVLALPHSGNWDAAGVWLVDRNGPFTTVAERLKPESLFDRFVAYRESLGMEVIALTGGERPPTEVLAERLRANGIICLLADRDLSRNGIEVDFFGEPTRMPAGPAMLAAITGATLLGVHHRFEGAGWGDHRLAADRARRGPAARRRSPAARRRWPTSSPSGSPRYPADWHMLQRLWLADLPPDARDPRPAPRCVEPSAAER